MKACISRPASGQREKRGDRRILGRACGGAATLRAGHSVTLFEKQTASAACFATAFPISKWKSG